MLQELGFMVERLVTPEMGVILCLVAAAIISPKPVRRPTLKPTGNPPVTTVIIIDC